MAGSSNESFWRMNRATHSVQWFVSLTTVRLNIWRALFNDDATTLLKVLRKTANHQRLTMQELLATLEREMWNPDAKDRGSRGGVLSAAAGNRYGVPVAGAERCVVVQASLFLGFQ